MPIDSAGSGAPYWYEWTVGLRRIAEMLDTDSGIESVTLQAHGTKGWDDVRVQHAQSRDWYQVKHSRAENNLTFGDLVSACERGSSLLNDLFSAWRKVEKDSADRFILFTNREAGTASGRSREGVQRPALLDFASWLGPAAESAQQLNDITPPLGWADAWCEWLSQLGEGSDDEILQFLRAFKVETDQSDLDELTTDVLETLGGIFGVTPAKARPLLQALDSALRTWTRDGKPVTAERAMDALALEEKTQGEFRAPPPPAPFFPSREPFVRDLERQLTEKTGLPILFLSAEPGSGKTSVLSELANRRTDNALQGVVGLRYFAFRPITPDSPVIEPDAGRYVRAESLWFDLLRQLRRGLRGQLRAYRVPVRDELISWPEAREQVLRLTAKLGDELGRPFTIAIDGIDHAARAGLEDPIVAKEFFDSLPVPEEIVDKSIRLILAGQPSENYPQYPAWLRSPHPLVQMLGLPRLTPDDIHLYLTTTVPQFPAAQCAAAVRVIHEVTGGNTLGVVFAVAEAAMCENAQALRQRLESRQLQSGITSYYESIWRHCLSDKSTVVEPLLAGAISLIRERITGTIMASAFPGANRSEMEWGFLLGQLGPLLLEESGGYRVRHNDLRVFLQSKLASYPAAQRCLVASGLANHYAKPSSSRQIAHASLLFLLRQSGREHDWPRTFTVDWVMEAAALGIDYDRIEPQCKAALEIGSNSDDWEVMEEIACACETLERWQELCEGSAPTENSGSVSVPTFLRTEVFVRPLKEWESTDLRRLSQDANELLEAGESARAAALLHRWLGGLDIPTIVREATNLQDEWPQIEDNRPTLGRAASDAFETLGAACRKARIPLDFGKTQSGLAAQAAYAFEMGWVTASCDNYAEGASSVVELFAQESLRFLGTIIQAAEALARRHCWPLIRDMLVQYAQSRSALIKFRSSFGAHAAWWALRSGAAIEVPEWVEPQADYVTALASREGGLLAAISIARTRGWQEVGVEPGTIADALIEALSLNEARQEYVPVYAFWLRVAATLGRADGVLFRTGRDAASQVIRPQELQNLAAALWDRDLPPQLFSESSVAGDLAVDLVDLAIALGSEHLSALVDTAVVPLGEWPIDYRRASLWKLLRGAGETQRLREWVDKWLSNNGFVWTESADGREYTVDRWAEYTPDIGADDLLANAKERLSWCRISYRSDRDDSFFAASELLSELLKIAPSEWASVGHRLWSLIDGANGVGAGNNHDAAVAVSLTKAALAVGPEALCRVMFADEPNRRDDYWHYEAKNRLINAVIGRLTDGAEITMRDRLTFWCLAVGFCRWFNEGDVKLLSEFRRTLLETLEPSEREGLSASIERLTPAEAIRQPKEEEERPSFRNSSTQELSLETQLQNIREGNTCGLAEAARLVREVLRTRATEAPQLIPLLLQCTAGRREYATSWRSEGRDALASACELGKLLTERQMWLLLQAVCREAGIGSHWLQGLTDNLHVVLIARAAAKGLDTLRGSLGRQMAMHEKWIRGGRVELSFKDVLIPTHVQVSTWSEAATHIFVFLLNSRSGEVIASVLHGLHALVLHDSTVIRPLFRLIKDDLWMARWVLNAAEAWAGLVPNATADAHAEIEHWSSSHSLEHRLQGWLVLVKIALDQGTTRPALGWNMHAQEIRRVVRRGREILEAPPETAGLMRMSYRHRAAAEQIRIVEATLGDLPAVTHRAAELLDELPPEKRPRHSWPQSIRQHGDVDIGLHDIGLLVGQAIDETMDLPPPNLWPRLAQAFLPNEEPWVLRTSPLPDGDVDGWPAEGELGSWREHPNLSALRERLLLLTCDHGVSPDERVIAATVEVYSTFHDVRYHVWWETAPKEEEIRGWSVPTTISARSFCWLLSDWWEPRVSEKRRPIAFVPGGFQRLPHSFVDWVPARAWVQELGWEPDSSNPLIWVKNGRRVARYQRLHGQARRTQNYHHRQPVLGRWLVTEAAFENICETIGEMRRVDDIDHAASPER
jgi:hypothetical protein